MSVKILMNLWWDQIFWLNAGVGQYLVQFTSHFLRVAFKSHWYQEYLHPWSAAPFAGIICALLEGESSEMFRTAQNPNEHLQNNREFALVGIAESLS